MLEKFGGASVLVLVLAACVGDEVEDGPGGRDAGSSDAVDAGADSGTSPGNDAATDDAAVADGGQQDASVPVRLAGRVLDQNGLAARNAQVRVSDADGAVHEYSTDADGRFVDETTPPAPYNLQVRRADSAYTHLFSRVSRLDPVLRLYGEEEVLPSEVDVQIDLTDAPATTRFAAAMEGSDGLTVAANVRSVSATGLVKSTVWSRNPSAAKVALGMLTFGTDGLSGSVFLPELDLDLQGSPAHSGAAALTESLGLVNGLSGISITMPPSFTLGLVAAKLPLGAGMAPAYGTRLHERNAPIAASNAFQAIRFPTGEARTVTLEALASRDTFEISGRGIVAVAPYSYRRIVGVASQDVRAMSLPTPASISFPSAAATNVARATTLRIAAAADATSSGFVNLVLVKPVAASSNAPKFVVHLAGTETILPDAALAASTEYSAQVVAIGPFAGVDAYLAQNVRLPPQLAVFTTKFAPAEALLRSGSLDDGALTFTTSDQVKFTTAP